MIRAVILVSVIAAVLVAIWDVRRRKAKLNRPLTQAEVHQQTAEQKSAQKKLLIAFGVVFLVAGVWMLFAPPSEASSGPKSLIMLIP